MYPRTLATVLLCCLPVVPALAHHPLPEEWRREPIAGLLSIGDFDLGEDRLATALADEMSAPPANCDESALSDTRTSGPSVDAPSSTTFWSFEPLSRCGVVERHYEAATRLARSVCEQMSIERRIWPPAIPVVALPHTYLDAKAHHAGAYHIDDGPLIGSCVIRAAP